MTGAADLVLVNGTVITVDAGFRLAGGVAVSAGRIAAVGSAREVAAMAGPATVVVDLAGGAVLPGINDSHLHAAMLGAYWPGLWMDALAGGGQLPEPRVLRTDAERRAALRRAFGVLLPLGITSYTEPGIGPGGAGQHGGACGGEMLRTYAAMAAAGELPVRVSALLLFGELDGPSDLAGLLRGLRTAPPPGHGLGPPGRWRVAGVKLFADGIPPMRTAWMSEPYPGGGYGGLLVRGRGVAGRGVAGRVAALRAMVRRAHEAGYQVGIHATGSRAISESVAALAAVSAGSGRRGPRHYIIHGDCAPAPALREMSRCGIGLNAQPCVYAAARPMLEAVLGTDRAGTAMPARSAVDAGVALALSSDAPVATPDWREAVAAAATRRCPPACPVRGGGERVSVAEAIRGYTIAGARQDHSERWKGSIEPGKVADLCVLAKDPLAVHPSEIPGIAVTMTLVDGAVVFDGSAPRQGMYRDGQDIRA